MSDKLRITNYELGAKESGAKGNTQIKVVDLNISYFIIDVFELLDDTISN